MPVTAPLKGPYYSSGYAFYHLKQHRLGQALSKEVRVLAKYRKLIISRFAFITTSF